MPPIDSFHLSDAAARKYQNHSVPAMFGPLAEATVGRLTLPENGHILDVACGTGALTRVLLDHLPGRGRVVGTDLNQTMLDVAQSLTTPGGHNLEWVASDVTALPFDDESFDFACIQQGLQFFPDKPAALSEVCRVLKRGGFLCLTCWRTISPFNDALAQALTRFVSDSAATKARAPFSFRDGNLITSLLQEAGFEIAEHDAIVLQRRFDDLKAQILALPVEKDIREKGAAVTEQVIADAATSLAPYAQGGVLIVPQEAHFFWPPAPDTFTRRIAHGIKARMAKQLDYHTIREIFTRFQEADPEPKGELEHVNVYTLVVAVALSAQATDAGVNKATRELFKIADTPQKMLDLGEEGLIEHIKTIGLFRQKAKNVIKLSRILVDDYGGEVPNSRAALQSLPGVGRKTANVVLNMWWRQPAQAVDTHIFRVGNRTGICPGKDVDAVERAIEDNIPADFQLHAHHWLILHGRYHCKARKPLCGTCIIRDLCQFEDKNL